MTGTKPDGLVTGYCLPKQRPRGYAAFTLLGVSNCKLVFATAATGRSHQNLAAGAKSNLPIPKPAKTSAPP
jgi:hypothetical protein